MSNVPLPEPVGIVWSDGRPHHTYAVGQLHAHAAAVSAAECAPLIEEIEALRQDGSKLSADNAALRERVRVLEEALEGAPK
jgi:cell division protein FtsB